MVVQRAHPNTCVLPGMFHRQESASKIQHVQGPFGNFQGNCDKLEGLKVDKSRFSRTCVASVDGPMNYWGQRNTFSSTKIENIFYFLFSDVFYFYGTSWASLGHVLVVYSYSKEYMWGTRCRSANNFCSWFSLFALSYGVRITLSFSFSHTSSVLHPVFCSTMPTPQTFFLSNRSNAKEVVGHC
jgi:hypothetical protein